MNSTSLECSLNDTEKLKKLIVENPEFPLMVFCGEDCWHDVWHYEQAMVNHVDIEELTLYNDMWLTKDDYREKLSYDLSDDYEDLTDEEYEKLIDEKVASTEFVETIVIYVG